MHLRETWTCHLSQVYGDAIKRSKFKHREGGQWWPSSFLFHYYVGFCYGLLLEFVTENPLKRQIAYQTRREIRK